MWGLSGEASFPIRDAKPYRFVILSAYFEVFQKAAFINNASGEFV